MKKLLIGVLPLLLIISCKKDEEVVNLKNAVIKKTISPLIVGDTIQFAYGMGSLNGKLEGAEVIASIPGASGTNFGINTYRTVNAVDIATVVAKDCATSGNTSTATIIDTNATTLRYYYVIPGEARGQQITFTFSTHNRAGDVASYTTPSYTISKMDMKRIITLTGTATGARYFSIADMKAYTANEVDAGNLSAKIDFVYAYAATITPGTTAYTYGHCLVSPAATGYFPTGFTIPVAWQKNSTLMEKKIGSGGVYDGQLKGDLNTGIYITDNDLQEQSFAESANYALTFANDGSVFMQTADGKYTAFVYINTVTNASATAVVSIKRFRND